MGQRSETGDGRRETGAPGGAENGDRRTEAGEPDGAVTSDQ
ncbi:hypothetical protein [Prosthecochloris ethylica]|nr:hypothetical protein [Prosthecochloris ethylica]